MKIFNAIIKDNLIQTIKGLPIQEKGNFVLDLNTPPPVTNTDIANNSRYVNIPMEIADQIYLEISNAINADIQYSNCIGYPPYGGMDWHTNGNDSGIRIYASWSETGNSGMLWYKDNKVIIDQDVRGLNVRAFSTPCWHGVWAKCYRYSIGFKIRKSNTNNIEI